MDVVEQGPWGEPAGPDPARTFQDALPGDTVRFTPLVADAQGPIPTEELSARWVLCPANGCLDALSTADELEPCSDEVPYTQVPSCALGSGPTAEYRLGPLPLDLDSTSIFALAFGPGVGYVASRQDAPGADACVKSLRARESLEGCVLMLRDVDIGPPSALTDAAEASGLDVEISESSETLLALPRNRNPEVRRVAVTGSSRTSAATVEAMPGQTIPVTAGDELLVEWLPEDEDFDDYQVEVSGETLDVEENVTGRWFIDQSSPEFTQLGTAVRFEVGRQTGITHLYFVLTDPGGSETWGWFLFDVS